MAYGTLAVGKSCPLAARRLPLGAPRLAGHCPLSPSCTPTEQAEAVRMAKKLLKLVPNDGFTVLNLGDMEIWDGADMALLRESLTRLIPSEKHPRIGLDIS